MGRGWAIEQLLTSHPPPTHTLAANEANETVSAACQLNLITLSSQAKMFLLSVTLKIMLMRQCVRVCECVCVPVL